MLLSWLVSVCDRCRPWIRLNERNFTLACTAGRVFYQGGSCVWSGVNLLHVASCVNILHNVIAPNKTVFSPRVIGDGKITPVVASCCDAQLIFFTICFYSLSYNPPPHPNVPFSSFFPLPLVYFFHHVLLNPSSSLLFFLSICHSFPRPLLLLLSQSPPPPPLHPLPITV